MEDLKLKAMEERESRGEGRIFWRYADSSYGSSPEPIWIPKDQVPLHFNTPR